MSTQKRPTALGAIAIIFSILAVVGSVLLLIGLFAPNAVLHQTGDIIFTLFGTISYVWALVIEALTHKMAMVVLVMILILIIPLLLLIGGIGLVQNRPWGRTFCYVYGIMKLTLDILTIFGVLIFMSVVSYGARTIGVDDIFAANPIVVILLVAISLIFPVYMMVYLGTIKPVRNTITTGGMTMVHPGNQGSRTPPPTRDISLGTNPSRGSNPTVEVKPQGLGRRSARLVVVSGRDLHREYPITIEDFQGNPVHNLVGSSSECQVIISGDPSVSKRHCEIRMENGHLCLFNLASTNPTLICRGIDNRIQVSGKEFLKNSDRIWIGSTELQIHISAFNENDLGR